MKYSFEQSGKLEKMTTKELAEADENSAVIVRNTGTLDDGSRYWAYIAVKPSKYKEFMRSTREHNPILLGKYGTILKCGFGDEIPPSVQAAMKEQYGFDEHFVEKLTHDFKEARKEFLNEQQDKRITDALAILKNKA